MRSPAAWRRLLGTSLLAVVAIGSSQAGESRPPGERGGIVWASSFENALEEAQVDGKPVMVDFYTDWCGWCKRLDADTYSDSDVAAHARRLVCVKVNAERRSEVARRYGVRAYPSIAFLQADGTLMEMIRGYLPPKQFISVLDRIGDPSVEKFTLAQRLKDHPDLLDIRRDMVRLLIRNGEMEAALGQIDSCLGVQGGIEEESQWDLRLDRARALLSLGRVRDARKGLKEYVDKRKRSPRHAEAVYFYAEACLADGNRKEARKFYRKVIEERPQGWLADRSRSRLGELG